MDAVIKTKADLQAIFSFTSSSFNSVHQVWIKWRKFPVLSAVPAVKPKSRCDITPQFARWRHRRSCGPLRRLTAILNVLCDVSHAAGPRRLRSHTDLLGWDESCPQKNHRDMFSRRAHAFFTRLLCHVMHVGHWFPQPIFCMQLWLCVLFSTVTRSVNLHNKTWAY